MLHLINESDRGEGEAQPGNGPEERGQFKWGICLLQGRGKKKKLLKAGTQTSLVKNRPCKSVQFQATKLTPLLAFCLI